MECGAGGVARGTDERWEPVVAEDATQIDVQDVRERNAYVATLDRQEAVAEYILLADREPPTIILTHTEVPEEMEGHGVGSTLVRHALDDARERGLVVQPQCPFVRSYIERHDEYADLVDF
jgi:predicted GNAT family acetyltransferase